MDIFFASDNKYFQHLMVAIYSIYMKSNSKNEIYFHVLDGGIEETNKNKLKSLVQNIDFLKPEKEMLEKLPMTEMGKCWGEQMYYRYFIPYLKPEIEKALYLDCDIAAFSAVEELWNTDLGENYCAAVKDYNNKYSISRAVATGNKNYFNSGVLLINCKKWREENITELLIKNTKLLFDKNELIYPDQDTLNYTFKDNFLLLNPKFNFQANSDLDMLKEAKIPVIVHYNGGDKPWNKGYDFYPSEYLIPLYKAGYKKEFFKIKLNHFMWKIFQTIISVKNEYENGQKYKKLKILGLTFRFKK